MSPTTYYFINKTRKEFCGFDDTLPVLQALLMAITKHDWTLQDDIKVEAEYSDCTFLVEYLTRDKGFMWLV
jgi:hypothetical protein